MGVTIITASSVPAGQTRRYVTLHNGQELFVYGTATDTQIDSGGVQFVYAGGTAQAAQIYAGGVEYLSGGKDVSAEIYSGGAEYVISGVVSNTTVFSGGSLYLSGGTAYTLALEGGATIAAGATASDITVDSGGTDAVIGGHVTGTTVQSAGAEYIASGGIAYATLVESGAVQQIAAQGSASNTTVSSGGIADIGSGGAATNITILHGGSEIVSGIADLTLIASGGQAVLLTGGSAAATRIDSGGVEILSSGASSTDASVLAGGVELVLPGGVAESPVLDGGELVLLPGAISVSPSFESGGGQVTTGVVLVNPGSAAALFNATATSTTVQAAGAEYVLAGGSAIAAQVAGNAAAFAVLEVFSGGLASGAVIGSGGQEYVFAGGHESHAMLNSAGYLYVSGGSATSDTLHAGAAMYVQGAGALAVSTVLSGGSVQFVGPDGVAQTTVVSAQAVQALSGGISFQGRIDSGGNQYVDSGGVSTGTTILGEETVFSGGEAAGTGINGGTLNLSAGAIYENNIGFVGGGGTLIIHGSTLPAALIENFVAGDAIDLDGLAYNSGYQLSVPAAGTLAVAPGFSLHIQSATSPAMFNLLDNDGEVEITTDVSCFAAGTRILTPRGYLEVEALEVGGRVITQAGEDAEIIWIGRRRVSLLRHPEPSTVQPVRIRADSLGDGEPSRDLLLSPDHAVLCGGVLVPAKALVNGVNITQLDLAQVTYFHIELQRHSIIFAEDLAVETYLDTGNRGGFESVVAALPRADGQRLRELWSCAPFAERGPVVAEARSAAARRALCR